MNSQWSDNLRKRMEAHDTPSPDGLWEDIELAVTRELPFRTVGKPVQSGSGQKKKLLWIKRIGAVAAVLLVLFLIGDFFLKKQIPHSPLISQGSEVEHKPENNHSPSRNHDNKWNLLAEEDHREPLTLNNNTVTFTTLTSTASINRKIDDFPVNREAEVIDPKNEAQRELPEEVSGMEEKVTDRDAISGDHHNYHIPESNPHYPIVTRRNKPVKWTTGLYTSNSSSGSSKAYNGYRSFLAEGISGERDEITPLLVKYPHEGVMAANKQNTVHTEAKHRQPVTMGASIKYNIDEKWSLTSGLTYTILSSQLRSGSDNHYYTSEQTLHNIGIPLSINYNLWKGRNISFYLSGGGMAEKNISGKLSTDYIVNGKFESTEREHISIDQLQWSLNTSAGIEYNLFSKIGLYAEPGVVYYLKNGSGVETIYKEKPINFNLRVGLRFSLGE